MHVKPHKAKTHTNDMYICYGYRAHLSECISRCEKLQNSSYTLCWLANLLYFGHSFTEFHLCKNVYYHF